MEEVCGEPLDIVVDTVTGMLVVTIMDMPEEQEQVMLQVPEIQTEMYIIIVPTVLKIQAMLEMLRIRVILIVKQDQVVNPTTCIAVKMEMYTNATKVGITKTKQINRSLQLLSKGSRKIRRPQGIYNKGNHKINPQQDLLNKGKVLQVCQVNNDKIWIDHTKTGVPGHRITIAPVHLAIVVAAEVVE